MTYDEFLKSSPRIIGQLNKFNKNYEKRLLLEVVSLIIWNDEESQKNSSTVEKEYVDSFGSMFDKSGT